MIRHRARQFFEAGRRPRPADFELGERWLPAHLQPFYRRQHPRDVVHAAATARWLLVRGHDEPELIAAALLHDIGKGEQRRLDRVAFVLARGLGIHRRLGSAGSRFGLRRAVWRSLRHPARGAEMLRVAGAGEGLVDLVRRHHSRPEGDGMLSLLEEADAAS